MQSRTVAVLVLAALLLAAITPVAAGQFLPEAPTANSLDSDGDGLSDYDERVKYSSNPNLADSDRDGVPDGDWDERREYVYSVRVLMMIRGPFDVETMNDLYQDVRILNGPDENGYTEIEAIIYPNTVPQYTPAPFPIDELSPELQQYTEAGIATNYGVSMQEYVVDNIVAGAQTDYEALVKVLQWVSNNTSYHSDTTPEIYYTYIEDEEVKLRNYHGDMPEAELLATHYFADSMFDDRTHGTCTSVATLKCAILKAAGIPCRLIQNILPIYYHPDQTVPYTYTDDLDREWNNEYVHEPGQSDWWCNHAYVEVYLGGHWIHADWGVNEWYWGWCDPPCLHLKILSVSDWSDVDFSETWPVDWIDERPYYTLLLEDQEPKELRSYTFLPAVIKE
jgi:hypothetical protein